MLAISWASDCSGRRRVFVWPFLLVGAVAFYASYLVGSGHFLVSFGPLIVAVGAMYAPYGPYGPTSRSFRSCCPRTWPG